MPPKGERLSRKEWQQPFFKQKANRFYTTDLFTCKYFSQEKNQYAVVMSSKHEKSAVKRNIVKRRLYTLIRKTEKRTGVYLLYPTKKAYTSSYEALQQAISSLSL